METALPVEVAAMETALPVEVAAMETALPVASVAAVTACHCRSLAGTSTTRTTVRRTVRRRRRRRRRRRPHRRPHSRPHRCPHRRHGHPRTQQAAQARRPRTARRCDSSSSFVARRPWPCRLGRAITSGAAPLPLASAACPALPSCWTLNEYVTPRLSLPIPYCTHPASTHSLRLRSISCLDNKRENVWRRAPGRSAGHAVCAGEHSRSEVCGEVHEDELLDMDFLNFPLDHCALDKLLLGVEPEQPNDIRCRIHWCVRPPQ